ncbi:hypothetical protein QFZ51_005489 [Chitinophaga sp. W3I9]
MPPEGKTKAKKIAIIFDGAQPIIICILFLAAAFFKKCVCPNDQSGVLKENSPE